MKFGSGWSGRCVLGQARRCVSVFASTNEAGKMDKRGSAAELPCNLAGEEFGVSGRDGFGNLIPVGPWHSHHSSPVFNLADLIASFIPHWLALAVAVNTNYRQGVSAWQACDWEVRFKQTVPSEFVFNAANLNPQVEGGSAKHYRVYQRSTGNVLNNPWQARGLQLCPRCFDKLWVLPFVNVSGNRVGLARRARPNEVKAVKLSVQRVALVEGISAVMRLLPIVHTGHAKASTLQSLCCATGPTKQIKSRWLSAAVTADGALLFAVG